MPKKTYFDPDAPPPPRTGLFKGLRRSTGLPATNNLTVAPPPKPAKPKPIDDDLADTTRELAKIMLRQTTLEKAHGLAKALLEAVAKFERLKEAKRDSRRKNPKQAPPKGRFGLFAGYEDKSK